MIKNKTYFYGNDCKVKLTPLACYISFNLSTHITVHLYSTYYNSIDLIVHLYVEYDLSVLLNRVPCESVSP